MNRIEVGLINNRHEMPVSEYIFEDIENTFDFDYMNRVIVEFIKEKVGIKSVYSTGINQTDYTDVEVLEGDAELVVYITGLTAVTAELVKVCALNGVPLTLMHWDNINCKYLPQKIF